MGVLRADPSAAAPTSRQVHSARLYLGAETAAHRLLLPAPLVRLGRARWEGGRVLHA